MFLQWSQAWLQAPQADQPCNLLTRCLWEVLPSWSCSELRGTAVPSPHSHALHGPRVSVWGMIISSQSLSQVFSVSSREGASVYLCFRNEKASSHFVRKCLGRKRNEHVITASWNLAYSDSFVPLDSGPWLSALQLHLPEMQTGFFCGFWVCWLVGWFGILGFLFFRKPAILCYLKILWCLQLDTAVSLDMIKKLTLSLPRWWDKTLVVVSKTQMA